MSFEFCLKASLSIFLSLRGYTESQILYMEGELGIFPSPRAFTLGESCIRRQEPCFARYFALLRPRAYLIFLHIFHIFLHLYFSYTPTYSFTLSTYSLQAKEEKKKKGGTRGSWIYPKGISRNFS